MEAGQDEEGCGAVLTRRKEELLVLNHGLSLDCNVSECCRKEMQALVLHSHLILIILF